MTAFAEAFSVEARKAAHRLFSEGRVRVLTQDDAFLSTSVKDGDSSERVLIRRRLDRLQVSCTCARGSSGACAHVLASMLATRDSGFGAPPATARGGRVDGGRLQLKDTRRGDSRRVSGLNAGRRSEVALAEPEGDHADGDTGPRALASLERSSGNPGGDPLDGPESDGSADDFPAVDWRFRLAALKTEPRRSPRSPVSDERAGASGPTEGADAAEIVYAIDAAASQTAGALVVVISHRERRRDGQWGRVKFARLFRGLLTEAPDPIDREILHLLSGADRDADLASAFRLHDAHRVAARYRIAPEVQAFFGRRMAETGRLFLRRAPNRVAGHPEDSHSDESAADIETLPLRWDEAPYRLALMLSRGGEGVSERYELSGHLARGAALATLDTLELATTGGLVALKDGAIGRLGLFEPVEQTAWLHDLAVRGAIVAPKRHEERLLKELALLPPAIDLRVQDGLGIERVRVAPRVFVRFKSFPRAGATEPVTADLLFDYRGQLVEAGSARGGFLQAAEASEAAPRRLLVRDPEAEGAARAVLLGSGASPLGPASFEVLPEDARAVVAAAVDASFRILVRDREMRAARGLRVRVSSGVDWFDLKGGLDFGSEVVPWPALLKSLGRGEVTVRLQDGSFGAIPEELSRRYARLAALGAPNQLNEGGEVGGEGGVAEAGLRFAKSQVALLDAIFAGETDVEVDATFEQARDRLRSFESVVPAREPETFHGELRPYQREGLGWMKFLHEFGFGGCLADDMGLGKTVQVLALLEGRRLARLQGEEVPPSLVVVPRSLVFNWKQEAARFAPELKVLDHTGPLRSHTSFEGQDVVLSTYGTLRSDVARWQQTTFDYAILDEAQAIKNQQTESARAARLIRARHRLALSGTPVENRVSELLSIFSFINPGLAAGSIALTELASEKATPEEREILSRGLRPFILRRRKEDVLQDLPAKFEETLYIELGAEQRKMYEELKEHFRFRITALLETQGLAKSRIQVLEALLRLRQAACHPGLLDDARIDDQDAKLESLLPRLFEVAAEGHRSLVFSQFTSYLAILKRRLEALGIKYAYLDGRTRDRKGVVETFERDETIPVFLVSLKAGGLGLNLTAADYVFILDPWWNPAAEMQAIARAHRIGQTRAVFAYRLVARDTVEEKVLELQAKKRELVETLLGVDKSAIGALRREDIELLLS